MKRKISLSAKFLIILSLILIAENSIASEKRAPDQSKKISILQLQKDAFGIPNIKSIGILSNDSTWNFKDRWRTGSYQRHWEWNDSYQLRFDVSLISPENLANPNTDTDRPYASILGIGLLKVHQENKHAFSYGVKFDFINELDLLQSLHSGIHQLGGLNPIDVGGFIVEPAIKPSAFASGRYEGEFALGHWIPFVETQAGTRNRITLGLDIVLTDLKYDWIARDMTTGHLLGQPYEQDFMRGDKNYSFDWVLGADASYFTHDYYIENKNSSLKVEPWQYRVRFGFRYHYENSVFFVGPVYLSPEFQGQREGQFLQTLSVKINF